MVQIRAGEKIVLSVISSLAATNVYAVARIRYDDGKRDTLSTPEFTPSADRIGESRESLTRAQRDGVVEDAFVNGTGLGSRGRMYVQVAIENGGRLCRGHLFSNHPVILGENVDPGPGGGHGWIHTVTGTDPAAAAEVSEAVPTNAAWKLLSFTVVCAQGITQTPTPAIVIDDGTTANRRYYWPSGGQSASTTATHAWFRGHDPSSAAKVSMTDTDAVFWNPNLPDGLILPEAYRIRTITAGIGANTNYAAPIFQVEEWLIGKVT